VDLAKARRQAAAKALKQPKARYARVTEDMFPALTHMPGPSVGLVLLLLMRSRADQHQPARGVGFPT
jgi:hypothetical protein